MSLDHLAVTQVLARDVDDLCHRFEQALQRGEKVVLEDWLPSPGPLREAALVEFVRREIEHRKRTGDPATLDDYFARYPQLRATLAGLPHVPGYEVLEELGRGNMGVVYKARQIAADRVVALKMILAGEHASAEERNRFRLEAQAVARLAHANIVHLYEVGEHDGRPFFSLELCTGGSLADRLAGTPLPPEEAARLIEVLARAMEAAHQRHVIHRDLKPANVLLAEDGAPKISDFGLAKKLDQSGQTATGHLMGTPSYMAPEQAAGRNKEVGPATDVYALGAILYECLTGRPPFRSVNFWDTLVQVREEEPVSVRLFQTKTPRDLETICLKCLRKEPQRRYASAADLADDLRRFLDGRPILARPIGPGPRAWKWGRRNPGKVAVLVALLLGLVGVALWQRAVLQQHRAVTQHLEALRREDASDDAAVRAYLAADRIDDAREGVKRAYERLETEPGLAAQRARWDRLRGLVLFYHQAEEAWFRAGEERYEEGRSACEAGLRHLDVLDDQGQFLPEWWDRLPAEDDEEQAERLQQEVYQQLLLLTYLRSATVLSIQEVRKPGAVQAFHSAIKALDQAHAHERARHWRPAQTVTVMRAILQELLRQTSNPAGAPAKTEAAERPAPLEPTHAIDYFFSGLIHYFLHEKAPNPLKRSFVRLLLSKSCRDLLNWKAPLATAEEHLREAVRLDPRRFWHSFVLGRTLMAGGKYREAELAFNTCVALRPEYPVTYQLRGEAICRDAQQLPPKEASRRTELVRRALRDADRGLRKAKESNNPAVYWSRGAMFVVLKDPRQALEAYASGLEQEQELQKKVSRRKVLKEVQEYANKILRETTDKAVKADAHAVLALVHLTKADPKQARDAAKSALAINPNHRRARAILDRLR